MNQSMQLPLVVDLPWTARVAAVLGGAVRRADGRAALATVALVVAMVAWNWARWLGEMVPDNGMPPEIWWSILCIEAVCNVLLVGAVLIADSAVEAGAPRFPAYAVAVVVAAAAGAWLQPEVRHLFGLRVSVDMPGKSPDDVNGHPWSVFFDVLQRSSLLVFIYVNQRTTLRARKLQQAAEVARAVARRRTLESRLQAMQARVEPRFLLATLAQVGQLYERDSVLAGAMLDDLIAYLRAALPHLRESSSTLGKEAALARAYLNILCVTAGGRLACDFALADGLDTARIPAMIMLPMISRVLANRVGPPEAEGHIGVAARAADGRLVLTVTGSNADFAGDEGDQALMDIKLRVDALYGDAATLVLGQPTPRTVSVVLTLPYEGSMEGSIGIARPRRRADEVSAS